LNERYFAPTLSRLKIVKARANKMYTSSLVEGFIFLVGYFPVEVFDWPDPGVTDLVSPTPFAGSFDLWESMLLVFSRTLKYRKYPVAYDIT
jgi:hypothetical protein